MRAFPSHPGTPDPEQHPATSGNNEHGPAKDGCGNPLPEHHEDNRVATHRGNVDRHPVSGHIDSTATRLPRRFGMLAGAATVLCSVAVAFAPSAGAAATAPGIAENTSARIGIMESTGAQPDRNAIADDFVSEFGYRPVIEAGMLVNPNGDCSSPVPLPREFDTACKAHDLGYDMLRYADSHGQPLGPWARQTADAALDQRMHESCLTRADALSRARCQLMAGVAATFVDLNSARQDYGVPVHEAMFDSTDSAPSPIVRYSVFGLLAAVFAATATFFARRSRGSRPTPTGVVPAARMPLAVAL